MKLISLRMFILGTVAMSCMNMFMIESKKIQDYVVNNCVTMQVDDSPLQTTGFFDSLYNCLVLKLKIKAYKDMMYMQVSSRVLYLQDRIQKDNDDQEPISKVTVFNGKHYFLSFLLLLSISEDRLYSMHHEYGQLDPNAICFELPSCAHFCNQSRMEASCSQCLQKIPSWVVPSIISSSTNATAVVIDLSTTPLLAGALGFSCGAIGGFAEGCYPESFCNKECLRPFCTSYVSDQNFIPAGSRWPGGWCAIPNISGVSAAVGYFSCLAAALCVKKNCYTTQHVELDVIPVQDTQIALSVHPVAFMDRTEEPLARFDELVRVHRQASLEFEGGRQRSRSFDDVKIKQSIGSMIK